MKLTHHILSKNIQNPLCLLYVYQANNFLEQKLSLRVLSATCSTWNGDNMTTVVLGCPWKSSSMHQLRDTLQSHWRQICDFLLVFSKAQASVFCWAMAPLFAFLLRPFGSGGFRSKEKLRLINGCGWHLVLSSASANMFLLNYCLQ